MHTVHRSTKWEDDEERFPDDARYTLGDGVAWRIYGWETQPDEDTEWSGYETRTGNVIAVMVGDNQKWSADPEDFALLNELDYCAVCGQVGCTHDGRERA
jgi:hypothetical protein